MIRCLAIDDEELALELLEDNIRKVPFLQLVASCNNPIEAMRIMQEEQIDLVFLDIQMPGLTGLQFIKSTAQAPMFILVTAYERYALESYDLSVVDYLVKPVDLERFIKACNKANDLYKLKHRPAEEKDSSPDYFFVNVDYSLLKILYADISWIEGLKDYVKIHFKWSEKLGDKAIDKPIDKSATKPVVARLSMKSLEDELPVALFLRIHKSYIVSKSSITAIRKNSVFIQNLELPVGDNYKEAIETFTRR
jgi:two-component system, LytTR family, response regulator